MTNSAETVTLSLSDEIAERMEGVMKQEGCTRSEFLQDALLHYIEECEWRQLYKYGERQAKEQGIRAEDVASLVEQYRAA